MCVDVCCVCARLREGGNFYRELQSRICKDLVDLQSLVFSPEAPLMKKQFVRPRSAQEKHTHTTYHTHTHLDRSLTDSLARGLCQEVIDSPGAAEAADAKKELAKVNSLSLSLDGIFYLSQTMR